MRPPTNTSAPRMLFPPTPTASASTHAAPFGNPIPICPKATPQAGMRPWPHISDTNRTKNLFSATTTAASSYGLAALTGPPSYDHRTTAAAFRYRKTRFTCACGLTPATRMVPTGALQERVCSEERRTGNPTLAPHQGWQPGRPAPFHILPFPYPESLCIMTPYPPQHQERTPL